MHYTPWPQRTESETKFSPCAKRSLDWYCTNAIAKRAGSRTDIRPTLRVRRLRTLSRMQDSLARHVVDDRSAVLLRRDN